MSKRLVEILKLNSIIKAVINFAIDFYTAIFLFLTIMSTLWLTKIYAFSLSESFLLSFLVINIGVRGLLAFFSNTYPPLAREIAKKYHWPTDCSLQREVAASEGAFGLLGILSVWFHGYFWFAVIIGYVFNWVISEAVGIVKIILKYFIYGEKRANKAIFTGMCLDLTTSILLLVVFLR